DGLGPAGDVGVDALHQDGGPEHGAVQHGADGAVGGFPHFLEVIFLHAGGVGGDGGALDGNAVFFGGVGGINGHLVVGFIAVGQAQVVILGFQIHIGEDEGVLNHLPQDAG